MILFDKIYTRDDLIDIESDISRAISDSEIPTDDYNFPIGEFKVTIEWKESFDIFKEF